MKAFSRDTFHTEYSQAPDSIRRALRDFMRRPTAENAGYFVGFIAGHAAAHNDSRPEYCRPAAYWTALAGQVKEHPQLATLALDEMKTPQPVPTCPDCGVVTEYRQMRPIACSRCDAIASNDPMPEPTVLLYVINLDERGEFSADVRTRAGETLFEIPSAEALREMIEDGFIRHNRDLSGLQDYLQERGIIPATATIRHQ